MEIERTKRKGIRRQSEQPRSSMPGRYAWEMIQTGETKIGGTFGRQGVGGMCPAASLPVLRLVPAVRVNLYLPDVPDGRGEGAVRETRLGIAWHDRYNFSSL